MNISEKDNPENQYWEIDLKGKVTIDNFRYKKWLQKNGFFKYYPEGSLSFIFVRIIDNLVEDTTEVKIKDFVLKWLSDMREYDVYQLLTNQPRFFKDDILNTLDEVKIDFVSDCKDYCHIYFKNCAVEIGAKEIKTILYKDLKGSVWKRHIIDFNYENSSIECDFKQFIYNVSNKEVNREISIKSTIGYLLSSFKSPATNKAVIINDEMISDNPNGGTGKGILTTAIGKLKRTEIIDGKTFKFEKSFLYQTVSADTQIIAFDDAAKKFPFENLFSVVTEGITLEKKNKDAIKIPASKSPKILITTNYAIGGEGNSFDRRKWELEFSQHYNKNFTPQQEFGRLLFEEWDNQQWLNFYSYMISCAQIYIRHGLIESAFKNLNIRKFIASTSFEFYEWTLDDRIKYNERFSKAEKYTEFTNDYPDYKKLSQKRFSHWLESLADLKKMKYEQGNSQGQRWAELKTMDNNTETFNKIMQSVENQTIVQKTTREELPF